MEKRQLLLALAVISMAGFLYALPRRQASVEIQKGHEATGFMLRSNAFFNRGHLPSVHTCDGKDISPELHWTNAPKGTQSYAIVFHDTAVLYDPWNHWVVINIPAKIDHLDEQIDLATIDALVCTNSWDEQKYSGPCPPIKEHTYVFTIYALDVPTLPLKADAHRKDVIAAIKGHILAQAKLVCRYQRTFMKVKS